VGQDWIPRPGDDAGSTSGICDANAVYIVN
jgi:hypothetical protein